MNISDVFLFWFRYNCTKKYTWKYLKQDVIISCVLLISLNQNVSILFLNNIYIGNIRTVCHRKLYIKKYSSKSLWILSVFLVWFLGLKCFNAPKSKYVSGGKMFQYPPNCILLSWSVKDILPNEKSNLFCLIFAQLFSLNRLVCFQHLHALFYLKSLHH